MANYVIGLDLGTSATKTVLFDTKGKVIASASYEYPLYQPQNGWAEQDPQDWWDGAVATISNVLKTSNVPAEQILSLGMSGQMHGLVMLDAQGEVLRPSIIWADQRTEKQCEEITQKVGAKRLIEITANPALTGFTASKILWVRENEPEIYAKCKHILLPKDYIRYKLTGDFATEVSDASGMQLLDVPMRRWSKEVLDALEIDEQWLPKVYESPEVTGSISPQAAKMTGLSTSTLVVGGAGDNAAAAVGTGVVADGTAFATIGTSGVVFAHTNDISIDPKGRVHTFCCAVPGAWHVMGVVQAAGLSLRWLRDECCSAEKEAAVAMGMDPYDLLNIEAERSPLGANKLLYLPYLMGERTPHLDPHARGVFFGLNAIHGRQDLVRAVMEGVTFALNDSVEILRSMGVNLERILAVGGGGKSPVWRQMMADVFGTTVALPDHGEGGVLGAAILAMVGAGIYPDVATACEELIHVKGEQAADQGNHKAYQPYYQLYTQLYPALKDSFKALSDIV
ncbi:MAG: xylulokinase [Clostridiales bacterium]|nr:xylulokinase [Clostridiales bacterium]